MSVSHTTANVSRDAGVVSVTTGALAQVAGVTGAAVLAGLAPSTTFGLATVVAALGLASASK